MSIVKALRQLSVAIFLSTSCFLSLHAQSLPEINKGRLDLSKNDIGEMGTIDLSGEWEFYYHKLLFSADFHDEEWDAKYAEVPSIWNDMRYKGIMLNGRGYATYRLIIKKDPEAKLLALYVPNVYTAYRLYANGQLIASNGKVGKSKEEVEPQWKPTYTTFISEDHELELIWQVANFHHHRGGIHKLLKLGTPEEVVKSQQNIVAANLLSVGGLLVLGFFFIVFFFIRKGQLATLYFGLFCLLWAVRILFSNIYLISELVNLPWSLSLRIEYLSLYASAMVGVLFITKSFKDIVKGLFKWIIITINYLFIAITLILPPIFFTSLLPAYQFFLMINLVYIAVVVIQALQNKQKEAWFSAAGILVGILSFAYELTAYIFMFKVNLIVLNLGYLAIFFLNSLVIAHHFVIAYQKINNLEREKEDNFIRLRGIL
ncbi:7TM-DISM domain-containing protein [Fulvivirga sediminis]|uniref:7TM-DISM domain-containing protein n=1 Tax=Fulvivirga sediminis TaxID=2803949 RepID=A0A937F479_9BACT|nr:7TM-DISM domain-containing protein [Fulvivirga sediminis]MBL3654706.1 7TM-DISM domain-containing protein [Fulvivirga sediminis]